MDGKKFDSRINQFLLGFNHFAHCGYIVAIVRYHVKLKYACLYLDTQALFCYSITIHTDSLKKTAGEE
jgi:hypothetical protein